MLRLAIVQLRPYKGAYQDNLARFGGVLRDLARSAAPPDLVIAPESALTGYFLEGGVRELALPAETLHADLAAAYGSDLPPVDVALGFYEVHENRLYNSALYTTLGGDGAGIRHIHRKIFLPTYGVFDEERFVEAGRSVQAFETRWGRAAMLVCEDVWHSLPPMIAALDGAQLLIVPSASPARGIAPGDGRPASLRRWERLVEAIAGEHGIYVALAQLVGFEGGKAFVGGAMVADPRGELIVNGPVFDDAVVPAEIDLDEITRARADLPLLSDLEMRLPHLLGSLHGARRRPIQSRATGSDYDRPSLPVPSRPAAQPPSPLPSPLAIDPALTRRWLVEFLRDEVTRRRGFRRAIIGLSGGVDSSLVACLAAEALGPENVIGVRMPYHTSSSESLEHAQLVVEQLGIECRTVDISSAVDGLAGAVGYPAPTPGRLGNIMARARMVTLFDLSAALDALPIGTGNKTERLFGYFTWHADDSPPVNPLGDLFKTQVWELARHVGVPDEIVNKPASADLIRGQTDEGDFGISYPRADAILHELLLGRGADQIVARGFTADEVALVRRRLDSTHWKRRLPTVAMVSQTAIGEYYLRPVDY
jgi:NAD+ synthetase